MAIKSANINDHTFSLTISFFFHISQNDLVCHGDMLQYILTINIWVT